MSDLSTVEGLIAHLNEPDLRTRWNATQALIAKRQEAVEPLMTAFPAADRVVRMLIVRALGAIGALQALPLLTVALKDDDDRIRVGAVQALDNLTRSNPWQEPIIQSLVDALTDAAEEVRWRAALVLLQHGDERGRPVLWQTLVEEEHRQQQHISFVHRQQIKRELGVE